MGERMSNKLRKIVQAEIPGAYCQRNYADGGRGLYEVVYYDEKTDKVVRLAQAKTAFDAWRLARKMILGRRPLR